MTPRLNRRTFLTSSASAAVLPAFGSGVRAQGAYPNKPIRIICGYPAGGQTDIVARTYGEYLSRTLGQPVVVENKTGASGIIGATEVKRAPPDGYTLMCTISTAMIGNQVTVKDLPYDPNKDFAFLASLTQIGLVIAASARTGATNLKEFIDYARKTDKVSMGCLSVGSTAHMVITEINKQYGTDIEAVFYRGETPIWADVAGQTLDAATGSYNAVLPVMQGGRVRPIAVTGLGRFAVMPDVQTMIEQGATSDLFRLPIYTCFAAPAGTSPEIVRKLSDTIVAGNKDAKLQQTMDQFFLNPAIGSAEAQALHEEQTPKWIRLMQEMGLKAE